MYKFILLVAVSGVGKIILHRYAKQKNSQFNWCDGTMKNERQMPWKGVKRSIQSLAEQVILQQNTGWTGLAILWTVYSTIPNHRSTSGRERQTVLNFGRDLDITPAAAIYYLPQEPSSRNMAAFSPRDYDAILALKGIGPYTASAVASFVLIFHMPL